MATRLQLQELALLRLEEAESLFARGFYDGCATLGLSEYPERGSRLREAMKSHVLDDLGLLAGMAHEFTPSRPVLLANWSVINEWKPEWRYEPKGSYDRAAAEKLLEAIRAKPDGVLTCISARW